MPVTAADDHGVDEMPAPSPVARIFRSVCGPVDIDRKLSIRMAAALVTIVRASKKIQADPKEKQKYFERICRLDPVQALNF